MAFGKKDLREKIRNMDDRKYEDIHVSYWNEKLTLRSLTAAQSGSLQKMFTVPGAGKKKDHYDLIQATAAAMSVVDPDTHELVFSMDDKYWLKDKHAGALQEIWDKVAEMNGLTKEDQEELKNVLEASQKNGSLSD
jgi:hypothetical protein